MNKQQLIQSLSERLSLPLSQCQTFINASQEVLAEALLKGESVVLQGFVNLSPWVQGEREGRNPRTGQTCLIAPRVSVKFKPGKLLLKTLNPENKK